MLAIEASLCGNILTQKVCPNLTGIWSNFMVQGYRVERGTHVQCRDVRATHPAPRFLGKA